MTVAGTALPAAAHGLLDTRTLPKPVPRGEYASPAFADAGPSRREWYDLLHAESAAAGRDPCIVDWEVGVEVRVATHRLVTSTGGDVVQRYRFLMPGLSVTAHADGVTQVRSLNGYRGICQQGGVEVLSRFGFAEAGRRVAEEALELLVAPNCPSGSMDVLLMPDQMILQIHESIGHPLELDRILGDERNFAGTSFVTEDMSRISRDIADSATIFKKLEFFRVPLLGVADGIDTTSPSVQATVTKGQKVDTKQQVGVVMTDEEGSAAHIEVWRITAEGDMGTVDPAPWLFKN